MIGLFVCRAEGGAYEFQPWRVWLSTIASVPIFGVQVFGIKLIWDRIVAKCGYCPIRAVTRRHMWLWMPDQLRFKRIY